MSDAVGAELGRLGAHINVCERRPDDPPGDPAMLRFREAVAKGAIPFTVQGPENALCLDGGRTLGWEIADALHEGGANWRAFVQVGEGIEGLVHISEMSAHHVDLPEQVVTPGEELWVKIIDLDLQRRRISLSIKQAAEGGEVAEEYREHFGEHAFDEQGNYIGVADDA